ncbi:Probable sulfate transporter 4.2 [Galdieria sulphuraria]|nr:Probable sulfate transporter 4.2 [Galdieria sulphuraria]
MQKNSDSEANQTLPAFRGTFGAVLRSIFPSLKWFSSYDWFQFITDVFAGLTVGLVCSVQGLSYSLLARLPQSKSYWWSGCFGFVKCGSKHSSRNDFFNCFRIGFYLFYICCRTVILGFTSAVSIVIICNELGALLGISVIQSAYAWKVASFVFQNVSQLKIPTTMLSICVLMYFYVSKHYFSLYLQRFWQSIHSSIWYSFLMVGILVAMTLLNSATHFSSTFGMEVVGSVPQAFPKFRWPRMEMIREAFRIRTIATLTLLVLIESTSIALSLASKQHYKVNLNREVTSLGLANLFGGWVQCYPFAASFSRSAVNANAGAKTPVAQMIAALFLAFASWGLAEFLRYVPKCLLASVICISVSGLIEWEEWMRLLYLDAWELAIFTASFLAPLLWGSVWGLAFAIFTSYVPILFQLWRMLDVVDMRNKDWWRCCFRVSKEEQQHVIRLPKLLFFGNALSLVRCIEEELENVYMETDDFVALDASLVVYMDTISLDSLENWLQSDEKAKNRCIIRNLPSSLMTRVYDGRKLHKLINIWYKHLMNMRNF